MKKQWKVVLAALFIVVLAACGTSDEETNEATDTNKEEEIDIDENETDDGTEQSDPVEEEATDDATEEDDKNEKMKQLDFAEFELEVEYNDDQEYEAEIEKNSSGEYKSELEDELTNQHLKGDEAFDHIYPILEKVSIQQDATQEEVIKEVLEAFDLDSDYDEFEVEITFHDGTELEYEDK